MRIYTFKIYLKDAPHPWTFTDVKNFCTEGAYTRFDFLGGRPTERIPTSHIFRIIEQERKEND